MRRAELPGASPKLVLPENDLPLITSGTFCAISCAGLRDLSAQALGGSAALDDRDWVVVRDCTTEWIALPPAIYAELAAKIWVKATRALIDRRLPITATKRLREATGCGLSTAHPWGCQFPAGRRRAGIPCPYCGGLRRTHLAKQYFECGANWNNPDDFLRRGFD